MKYWKKLSLGKKIIIGIIVGLAIGFISPKAAEMLSPIGDIFLRMLKMLMVPLVFFSITSGVCKMGDTKQLATVGIRFIAYVIITSGITAAFGAIVGMFLHLGSGTTEFLESTTEAEAVSYNFIDNVVSWFPENVIDAMANANMLQIIIFSIFLGVALLALGEKADILIKVVDQASDTMLKITEFVMAFSPFGIASLMATMITTVSGSTMKEVLILVACVYGCGIPVLFVFYPVIIKVLAKLNALKFMKKISEPMLVAISTTSSAATLPVSIRVSGEKLGIPENIYGFTLPLGNTCGMNGFAMFLGLFCVFASNIYGYAITPGSIAQYVFLGIILSVGAAGVKGAGIVMTTVLLETMGMPLTLVPILAAIWPTIDPALTLMNNTSDLVGTTLIASQLKQVDHEVFDRS